MPTNIDTARILAQGVRMSNNTRITGINNNDLIVGPSGAGKTRGYVIPNILQAQENLIVADTKGNLYRQYGKYLKDHGYKVMCLNFADTAFSPWGYNPLRYIRKSKDPDEIRKGCAVSDLDVRKLSEVICPILNSKDPFWDQAARMYLQCFIHYVMNFLPEEEHHLSAVYDLLCLMGSDEFTAMMLEACDLYPDSTFTKLYHMIRQNSTAEKMDASIKGILATHLNIVGSASCQKFFTNSKQVLLWDFAQRKTALFLTVSDSDRSQDSLVNLFYTQALQRLIYMADFQPDNRLPIPTRFILDDFSTNTVIPHFDNIISVIRSREISVSLIIQSVSQLEGLYGDSAAQTIINNCDNCLYLGGQDVRTAEYFSAKLNKTVSTILHMPLDSVYLFTRGQEPRKAKRYDLDDDPAYRAIAGLDEPEGDAASQCPGEGVTAHAA